MLLAVLTITLLLAIAYFVAIWLFAASRFAGFTALGLIAALVLVWHWS